MLTRRKYCRWASTLWNFCCLKGNPPSKDEVIGPYPTVVEKPNGDKVLIVQDFFFGKFLGFLKVRFTEEGKVESWEGNPVLLNASIPEGEDIGTVKRKWFNAVKQGRCHDISNTPQQQNTAKSVLKREKRIILSRKAKFKNWWHELSKWRFSPSSPRGVLEQRVISGPTVTTNTNYIAGADEHKSAFYVDSFRSRTSGGNWGLQRSCGGNQQSTRR